VKCKSCEKKLNLLTILTANGEFYCKLHLPKVEKSLDSPLKSTFAVGANLKTTASATYLHSPTLSYNNLMITTTQNFERTSEMESTPVVNDILNATSTMQHLI
jgi:hypothetical protein